MRHAYQLADDPVGDSDTHRGGGARRLGLVGNHHRIKPKIEGPAKLIEASLHAEPDLAEQRMRRFFYKALSKVIIQVGVVLFVLPLIGLGLFFLGEWLVTGHWVRATLCTASYAFDDLRDGPSLETYEFIRCPINTGVAGIDLILNCLINELSLLGRFPLFPPLA